MGRKFIRFSNAELDTIGKALKEYGASDLLKQVEKEKAQREYDTKVLEEWMGTEQRKMWFWWVMILNHHSFNKKENLKYER